MRQIVGLAFGLLATALLVGSAQGQGAKSDKFVKTEISASKIGSDGKQTITVSLTPDKGWYIYANPVENEDMLNIQTTVKVKSANKLSSVKLKYPAGQLVKDALGDYKIYREKAVITATVVRASGDVSPLEVSATFQACNGKICKQPATVKRMVP